MWTVLARFGVLPRMISMAVKILSWHVSIYASRQRRMLGVARRVRVRPPPVQHLLRGKDKRDLKQFPAR